jgi:hypothetical protein
MCYCAHLESSGTANCLQSGNLTVLCYSLHLCSTGLQNNLSDEHLLSFPVGSLIVFTQSTFPNAHTRAGMATGSDKLYLSHKMRTLKNTRHLIVTILGLLVPHNDWSVPGHPTGACLASCPPGMRTLKKTLSLVHCQLIRILSDKYRVSLPATTSLRFLAVG